MNCFEMEIIKTILWLVGYSLPDIDSKAFDFRAVSVDLIRVREVRCIFEMLLHLIFGALITDGLFDRVVCSQDVVLSRAV